MDPRIEELYYVIKSIYPAWGSVIGDLNGRSYLIWAARLSKDIDYVQKLISDFLDGKLDEMIPNKNFGPSLINVSGIIKHYKAGEISHSISDHRELMSDADAKAMFHILQDGAKKPLGYKHDRKNYKRGDFERYLDRCMPVILEDMKERIAVLRKKMEQAQ